MNRLVVPELLDGLPPEAPEAIRSRRDLARINGLMGNHRWVMGLLENRLPGQVVELGAGDAALSNALVELGWKVRAIDLAPKPKACAEAVDWVQGNALEMLEDLSGDVLLGNLIWHHFQREELERFVPVVDRFYGLVAAEPWRALHAKMLGTTLLPFVNSVTRHDMFASITAGFRHGELPSWFGLGDQWKVEEEGTALGGYRLQAWKAC